MKCRLYEVVMSMIEASPSPDLLCWLLAISDHFQSLDTFHLRLHLPGLPLIWSADTVLGTRWEEQGHILVPSKQLTLAGVGKKVNWWWCETSRHRIWFLSVYVLWWCTGLLVLSSGGGRIMIIVCRSSCPDHHRLYGDPSHDYLDSGEAAGELMSHQTTTRQPGLEQILLW